MAIESTLYSLIEIEIEGNNGWAAKLPTPVIFRLGGKGMTLYHLYMTLLIFVVMAFQTGLVLNISSFLSTFAYFLQFLFIEDTLWFILNPFYTINKYTKKDIWWHSTQPWILGIPLDNYLISFYNIIVAYALGRMEIFISLLLCYFLYNYVCISFSILS